MLSSFGFTDTASTGSTGNVFKDIWDFASQSAKSYFEYDLAKAELKASAMQNYAQYGGGTGVPGAYDYTRFTNDGGLVGGVAGLKGDQVFLLGMGAIVVFMLVNKK